MRKPPLMTPEEVADFLRVPVGTLQQWRHRNVGPTPIKVGRHIRYSQKAVDDYVAANTKEAA